MTENNNQSVVQNDPVNHPAHYTAGGIEVIDFLESWNFPFHLANAIKYICRAGRKDKEVMYGSDQIYDTYPCRFPTVEFQLSATDALVEFAD